MGRTCQSMNVETLRRFLGPEGMGSEEHRRRGDYCLVMVQFSLGARIGEVIPLTWHDVWDFKSHKARERVTRIKLKTGCGKANKANKAKKAKKVKSGKGRGRGKKSVAPAAPQKPVKITGSLTSEAQDAVTEYFHYRRDYLKKHGRRLLGRHYVFCRATRTEPSSYIYVWGVYKRVIEELGLDTGNRFTYSTHSMRKTFAQMWEAAFFNAYIRRENVAADNMAGIKLAMRYAKRMTMKLTGHKTESAYEAYTERPADDPCEMRPAVLDEVFK